MKKFAGVAIVVASAVAGFGLRRAGTHPAPRPWVVEGREQLALAGLDAQYRAIEEGLAPVTTDARVRRAIVEFVLPRLRAADAAERDLQASVRARLGLPESVALVSSFVSGKPEWIDASAQSVAEVTSR